MKSRQSRKSRRIPGEETAVVINRREEEDRARLLKDTLEQAGFWEHIDKARRSLRVSRAGFRIVIKPDLALFDAGGSTGSDPELLERLIDQLQRRGYRQVTAADGPGSAALWLQNRDVKTLARKAGYRFITPDGHNYDVEDLSGDGVDGGFPAGSALYGSKLGRCWLDAHFRITIAKNKTHREHFFSLGLQNLLNLLPLRDKEYHYVHRRDAGEVLIELLRRTPVHFSIIDAEISNHGSDGSRRENPLPTHTLIAGENLLLADFAGALKMGLDPYASPLNRQALRVIGLPRRYKIQGSLAPYPGWVNVSPIQADAARKRSRSYILQKLTDPWFHTVNLEQYPFKNRIDRQLNRFINRWTGDDQNRPAALTAAGFNYLAAAAHRLGEYRDILFKKERIHRQHRTPGPDLDKYSRSDYESIEEYMEPLAGAVSQITPDRNGIRSMTVDQAVLLEYTGHLAIPFDTFCSRVDIAAVSGMMYDHIGGDRVPVLRDDQNRVTHQAERSIYLPQPNWMALQGGKFIDVIKLEFIRYETDRRRIYWRTVASPNQSALKDDGAVTFSRNEKDRVTVTVVMLQQLARPLFRQALDAVRLSPLSAVNRQTGIYAAYLSSTIANMEALYEGRNISAGREMDPDYGEPDSGTGRMPLEWALGRLFSYTLKLMAHLFSWDPQLQKNIDGFNGKYRFRIEEPPTTVTVNFHDNRIEVKEEDIKEEDTGNPNVTLAFKSTDAMMEVLTAPNPDLLDAMLTQKISVTGNLNYLFKFAYMVKRLQQQIMGGD